MCVSSAHTPLHIHKSTAPQTHDYHHSIYMHTHTYIPTNKIIKTGAAAPTRQDGVQRQAHALVLRPRPLQVPPRCVVSLHQYMFVCVWVRISRRVYNARHLSHPQPPTKPPPGLADRLAVTHYEACPDFHTSDHKPVRAAFEIAPAPDLYTCVYVHI